MLCYSFLSGGYVFSMNVHIGGYCSSSALEAAIFLERFGEHSSVMTCLALLVSKYLTSFLHF